MSDGVRATANIGRALVMRVPARLWGVIRRFDISKPLHLVLAAVLLGGIAAPGVNWLVQAQAYHLAAGVTKIVTPVSPNFASKLAYDASQQASVFNADGQLAASTPDVLTASAGAGGKKDAQLYTATLPDQAATGVTVHDNVNDVSVTFIPQFGLGDGKNQTGRVIYPLQNQDGKLIFTPKANGLKEDILLDSAPKTDAAEYHYKLDMPTYLQAKLLDDGSVGLFSGDPSLFGKITYGTDNDRTMVEKARNVAEKTYLMFKIPAPVIKQSNGQPNGATAVFTLNGNDLVVHVRGLAKASYPLSIDPTFVLSSTADFVLGSIDDNIDLSVANQVGRAALSGGSTPSWAPNTASLTSGNYGAGLVAYNSTLYLIGGGNTDTGTTNTTTTQVRYLKLNTDGSPNGTWVTTTSMGTARQGLQAYGFNGYLYAVGGDTNAAVALKTVEYAQITSTGAVGTWATTTSLNTARAFFAGATYQGVLYAMGGASGTLNAGLNNTMEYVRVNGDGTLGSWTQSTSAATGNLTSARDRFQGAAANGYIYVTGGLNGTPAVLATVEYAPIQVDGSVGAWSTLTSFPTARRDHGMGLINNHIYIYAGCSVTTVPCPAASLMGDTEYAVVNADGTIGDWLRTGDYNYQAGAVPYGARTDPSSAFYNGFLYFVGGCNAENSATDIHCTSAGLRVGTFATNFDTPGRFDNGLNGLQTTPPFNNNVPATTRFGAGAIALNGYLYYIGGESATGGTAYNATTEVATIGADGTLGAFQSAGTGHAAISIPAGSGNNAGRLGLQVAAYNNKIYVMGGIEIATTGGTDVFMNTVYSATQASDGTLGAWSLETNTLPNGMGYGGVVQWHNYIYIVGGRSSGTVFNLIERTQIQSNGTLGTWAPTTSNLSTARWAASVGIWGNWIYAVGGQSSTTAYVTAAASVERLTLTASGDVTTAAAVTAFPVQQRWASGFVHNGYLYTYGGITSASTAATTNIYYTALNATTGVPGTWSNTNIGNSKTCPAGGATACTTPVYGLQQARHQASAVDAGGYTYIVGGCTSASATGAAVYDNCTAVVTATKNTEVYAINNGGTGQATTFTNLATALPVATADHSLVAFNDKLYVVGGCTAYSAGVCSANSNDVESNTINPDGTLGGSWTPETALPSGRSLLQAAAYNGYMYVVGGRSAGSGASLTVWYAPIASTGTLGAWVDNSGYYLPSGADRRNFGMAIAGGYLYVGGGESAAGGYKNDVYYSRLASDGSLGTWTSGNAFTTARSGFNMVSYNGVLYVIGGTNGSNLQDIQYSVVGTAGAPGTWSYTTDVARSSTARQVVAANGYMYFIGNEGSGTDITYADINANGTLGAEQRSYVTLAAAHPHGAATWYKGNIFVAGACAVSGGVCTSVNAGEEQGGQAATARVGHYSKLFNTQVDTSPTQLVINGAVSGAQSAVEFRFQTASSSDPVLGVAQAIRPVVFGQFYNVQALNSSGVNVAVAFNYQYIITLDDSKSGTFPDVSSTGYSQTAVTDITLYYHANPARRLRHGASFTNTGCNPNVSAVDGCILDTAP